MSSGQSGGYQGGEVGLKGFIDCVERILTLYLCVVWITRSLKIINIYSPVSQCYLNLKKKRNFREGCDKLEQGYNLCYCHNANFPGICM